MEDGCIVCLQQAEGKPLYKKLGSGELHVDVLTALQSMQLALEVTDPTKHFICWDCDETVSEEYAKWSNDGKKDLSFPKKKGRKPYKHKKDKDQASIADKTPEEIEQERKREEQRYFASHCLLCNCGFDSSRGFSRFNLDKTVDGKMTVAQIFVLLRLYPPVTPELHSKRYICCSCFNSTRRSYRAYQKGIYNMPEKVAVANKNGRSKASNNRVATTEEHAAEIAKLLPPSLASTYKIVGHALNSAPTPQRPTRAAKEKFLLKQSLESLGLSLSSDSESSDFELNSARKKKTKKQMKSPTTRSAESSQRTSSISSPACNNTPSKSKSLSQENGIVNGDNVKKAFDTISKSFYGEVERKQDQLNGTHNADLIKEKENPESSKSSSSDTSSSGSSSSESSSGSSSDDSSGSSSSDHSSSSDSSDAEEDAGEEMTIGAKSAILEKLETKTIKVFTPARPPDSAGEEIKSVNEAGSLITGFCNVCGMEYSDMTEDWWKTINSKVPFLPNVTVMVALQLLDTSLADLPVEHKKKQLVCRRCFSRVSTGFENQILKKVAATKGLPVTDIELSKVKVLECRVVEDEGNAKGEKPDSSCNGAENENEDDITKKESNEPEKNVESDNPTEKSLNEDQSKESKKGRPSKVCKPDQEASQPSLEDKQNEVIWDRAPKFDETSPSSQGFHIRKPGVRCNVGEENSAEEWCRVVASDDSCGDFRGQRKRGWRKHRNSSDDEDYVPYKKKAKNYASKKNPTPRQRSYRQIANKNTEDVPNFHSGSNSEAALKPPASPRPSLPEVLRRASPNTRSIEIRRPDWYYRHKNNVSDDFKVSLKDVRAKIGPAGLCGARVSAVQLDALAKDCCCICSQKPALTVRTSGKENEFENLVDESIFPQEDEKTDNKDAGKKPCPKSVKLKRNELTGGESDVENDLDKDSNKGTDETLDSDGLYKTKVYDEDDFLEPPNLLLSLKWARLSLGIASKVGSRIVCEDCVCNLRSKFRYFIQEKVAESQGIPTNEVDLQQFRITFNLQTMNIEADPVDDDEIPANKTSNENEGSESDEKVAEPFDNESETIYSPVILKREKADNCNKNSNFGSNPSKSLRTSNKQFSPWKHNFSADINVNDLDETEIEGCSVSNKRKKPSPCKEVAAKKLRTSELTSIVATEPLDLSHVSPAAIQVLKNTPEFRRHQFALGSFFHVMKQLLLDYLIFPKKLPDVSKRSGTSVGAKKKRGNSNGNLDYPLIGRQQLTVGLFLMLEDYRQHLGASSEDLIGWIERLVARTLDKEQMRLFIQSLNTSDTALTSVLFQPLPDYLWADFGEDIGNEENAIRREKPIKKPSVLDYFIENSIEISAIDGDIPFSWSTYFRDIDIDALVENKYHEKLDDERFNNGLLYALWRVCTLLNFPVNDLKNWLQKLSPVELTDKILNQLLVACEGIHKHVCMSTQNITKLNVPVLNYKKKSLDSKSQGTTLVDESRNNVNCVSQQLKNAHSKSFINRMSYEQLKDIKSPTKMKATARKSTRLYRNMSKANSSHVHFKNSPEKEPVNCIDSNVEIGREVSGSRKEQNESSQLVAMKSAASKKNSKVVTSNNMTVEENDAHNLHSMELDASKLTENCRRSKRIKKFKSNGACVKSVENPQIEVLARKCVQTIHEKCNDYVSEEISSTHEAPVTSKTANDVPEETLDQNLSPGSIYCDEGSPQSDPLELIYDNFLSTNEHNVNNAQGRVKSDSCVTNGDNERDLCRSNQIAAGCKLSLETVEKGNSSRNLQDSAVEPSQKIVDKMSCKRTSPVPLGTSDSNSPNKEEQSQNACDVSSKTLSQVNAVSPANDLIKRTAPKMHSRKINHVRPQPIPDSGSVSAASLAISNVIQPGTILDSSGLVNSNLPSNLTDTLIPMSREACNNNKMDQSTSPSKNSTSLVVPFSVTSADAKLVSTSTSTAFDTTRLNQSGPSMVNTYLTMLPGASKTLHILQSQNNIQNHMIIHSGDFSGVSPLLDFPLQNRFIESAPSIESPPVFSKISELERKLDLMQAQNQLLMQINQKLLSKKGKKKKRRKSEGMTSESNSTSTISTSVSSSDSDDTNSVEGSKTRKKHKKKKSIKQKSKKDDRSEITCNDR